MPAYKPWMPSRSIMRFAAASVPVDAFFFSTCALVDSVINGYLSCLSDISIVASFRNDQRQCHGEEPSSRAGERVGNIVALLTSDGLRFDLRLGRGGEGVGGGGRGDSVGHVDGGL